MAGCILVDQDKLQVINRSPAYKNQYVHRRDSVTLAKVSAEEIQKRMRLGLVTASGANNDNGTVGDDEELEDSWEDFDMDDGDDDDNKGGEGENSNPHHANKEAEYVFDKGRRSSVDLACMSQNCHDECAAANVEAAAHRLYYYDEPQDVKRQCSREPSVSAIAEEDEAGGVKDTDEEVATVDGDQDVELRDATEAG